MNRFNKPTDVRWLCAMKQTRNKSILSSVCVCDRKENNQYCI